MKIDYDIVIIGAGICGLTAAIELSQKSKARILILEADDIAGGRVKSMTLPNSLIINTGAHWFHGGDDNAFYQWAKERYNLGTLVLDEVKGRIAIWAGRTPDAINVSFDILENAYEAFVAQHPNQDISLHDLAQQIGSEDVLQLAELMASEWMAVDSTHDISCYEYFNDPLGPGGWQMKDGMHLLINQMVDEARMNGVEIRFGAKVESVYDHCVFLEGGEELKAQSILVTVSAGVLHERSIAFDDTVQRVVAEKIAGLQMGNLVKIIVPMKEEFFTERSITSDIPVYMVNASYFVHARTCGKPTLTIFKGGTPSHDIELMDEAQAENVIADVLSQVPAFEGFEKYRDGKSVTTLWQGNTLARGSYSICKPHYKRSDPFFVGNIHFAGESFLADPANSPGQMKGAWQSGQMASQNMLKNL